MLKYFITFLLLSFSSLSFCKAMDVGFNEDYAKKMVNFAAASFIAPQTDKGSDLAKQCFDKSFPDGQFEVVTQYSLKPCAQYYSDECQLVIAKSEPKKMIVIAFRGTVGKDQMDNEAGASLKNYIDWSTDPQMGKVNKYFDGAANSLWENHVEGAITTYQNYTFAFTGHSLGGAVASLTALKARVKNLLPDERVTLYTFGEPRVGDVNLANTFRSYITNMYRVIHNSDLVPHMPMCQGLFSNDCKEKDGKPYHQPQEIWYNKDNLLMEDGAYKNCSWTEGEDPNCSNSLSVAVFFVNFGSDRGADMHLHYYQHKLDEYGPKGCNSAISLGISFVSLFLLFIVNLIRN
jgi:hypothetical protein